MDLSEDKLRTMDAEDLEPAAEDTEASERQKWELLSPEEMEALRSEVCDNLKWVHGDDWADLQQRTQRAVVPLRAGQVARCVEWHPHGPAARAPAVRAGAKEGQGEGGSCDSGTDTERVECTTRADSSRGRRSDPAWWNIHDHARGGADAHRGGDGTRAGARHCSKAGRPR